jgi:hypothetical protein
MVCVHPQREKIEDALLRQEACEKIGIQFGVSQWSVGRHSKHLGRSVITTGDRPLLDRVSSLLDRLDSIAAKAQSAKAWSAVVAAMREIREALELLARLTGQMPSASQGVRVGVAVNVTTGHSAGDLSIRELDVEIAQSVAEATNNFDPATIERMRRLAQRSAQTGLLLEVDAASSRQGSDCTDST